MKVEYPGLIKEQMPSGSYRYRVRVEGQPSKRIPISVDPTHKDFLEVYRAARAGIRITPETPAEEKATPRSMAWLTLKYLAHLERETSLGHTSPRTLKKRSYLLAELRKEGGEFSMMMRPSDIVNLRNKLADRPAWADSMVEAIRGMYDWALQTGLVDDNPAIGVKRINKGKGGANPWTIEDVKQFRNHHPEGTQADLVLSILLYTACRIGDAIRLGADNEKVIDGDLYLSWQPEKAGSEKVTIPVVSRLHDATRAVSAPGHPYLLSNRGKPYSTPDSLGGLFRKWCKQAGLNNHSAHGIRKCVGHLLAAERCTQYEIMCVHGHTQARTSEIYTKGIQRQDLAKQAMLKLDAIEG